MKHCLANERLGWDISPPPIESRWEILQQSPSIDTHTSSYQYFRQPQSQIDVVHEVSLARAKQLLQLQSGEIY